MDKYMNLNTRLLLSFFVAFFSVASIFYLIWEDYWKVFVCLLSAAACLIGEYLKRFTAEQFMNVAKNVLLLYFAAFNIIFAIYIARDIKFSRLQSFIF